MLRHVFDKILDGKILTTPVADDCDAVAVLVELDDRKRCPEAQGEDDESGENDPDDSDADDIAHLTVPFYI